MFFAIKHICQLFQKIFFTIVNIISNRRKFVKPNKKILYKIFLFLRNEKNSIKKATIKPLFSLFQNFPLKIS